MAISEARLNANRRNSLLSKGPVSESGKCRVRFNARKHGLRAESDAVAPDEAEAVAARSREWASAFPAADGPQRWIADQLVLASVRIDRCQEHQRSQSCYEAGRASSCWEVDRRAEAARLGARLASDPDRVVARLCCSLAGIDWLLERWRSLADLLEDGGIWDDSHRRLCLDLMRVAEPFREAELPRLAALPVVELRALVGETIAGLESLRESADDLDEADRHLAEMGLPTSEGPELRRLRRYENALWRRFRSLKSSWEAGRGRRLDPDDPDLDDPDLDDATAPPSLASSPAPPPQPAPPLGPPGPRPDRSASRPTPSPAPLPVAPASTAATPTASPASRLTAAVAPSPRNRRERRALQRAMAGRRSH